MKKDFDSGSPKNIQCPDCGKIFLNTEAYDEHVPLENLSCNQSVNDFMQEPEPIGRYITARSWHPDGTPKRLN